MNNESSVKSDSEKKHFDAELNSFVYRYPHPALTADCVVFGFDGRKLKILLVERGLEPFKGMWALPGGFMKVEGRPGESIDLNIEETARRELREETNIKNVYLSQFKVFSQAGRDPRERVVTVAFIALVSPSKYAKTVAETKAGDDASNAMWWHLDSLPPMAFDHGLIVDEAKKYLAEMIRIRPLAFRLLDDNFTMSQLQNVYEAVMEKRFDRRNFQRKALQSGWIKEDTYLSGSDSHEYDASADSLSEDLCNPSSASIANPIADHYENARKRKKFLFKNKNNDIDSANEEGSIKDLFNF